MTRVTNVGRKRNYIEAGFSSDGKSIAEPCAEPSEPQKAVSKLKEISTTTGDADLPPKKKRKRTKRPRPKIGGDSGKRVVEARESDEDGKGVMLPASAPEGESASTTNSSSMSKTMERGKDTRQKGLVVSERRRKQRIIEKLSVTICFACRAKGHTAKDCPKTKALDEEGDHINVVGVCYRCGSTRHTLSRCKKPNNHGDALPFASCFVCSGKGHLASSCPQNKTKGIYPNGGCCKLCGDSSHLAKDCGLRTRNSIDSSIILGTGRAAGADEDDFHIFKRQTIEMDRGDKTEEHLRRLLRTKAGTQKSTEKPSAKKVVYF